MAAAVADVVAVEKTIYPSALAAAVVFSPKAPKPVEEIEEVEEIEVTEVVEEAVVILEIEVTGEVEEAVAILEDVGVAVDPVALWKKRSFRELLASLRTRVAVSSSTMQELMRCKYNTATVPAMSHNWMHMSKRSKMKPKGLASRSRGMVGRSLPSTPASHKGRAMEHVGGPSCCGPITLT